MPTFAVDEGFRYAVADGQSVSIGSIVRVPLGGRKVRGFVTSLDRGSPTGLKTIRGVSGDMPVFDEKLLETLRWAALHYVAPMAGMIGKSAPPNLPRRSRPTSWPEIPHVSPGSLRELAATMSGGGRSPATYLLAATGWGDHLTALIAPVVAAGRSAMVVAATAIEARSIAAGLARTFGERVVMAGPDLTDRDLTTTWQLTSTAPGSILVGTHRVAFWPVARLGLAVIVEEGRRGMKDRQTPTVHAREILKTRARIERFGLVYLGRVPSTEVVGAGTEIIRAPGRNRCWQLVEVIDRSEEPPGSGILTDRVRAALRNAVSRNERVFLFTHRHGYAPASRCARCRELRRCPDCGSRPDQGTSCARCGAALGPCQTCGGARFEPLGAGVGRVIEEARRVVGSEKVGSVEDNRPVIVGTERDLIRVGTIDLTVAIDADGLILGTNYRAAEEALRVLVRVAGLVPFGRGKRLMVQTSQPNHPVITALRRGDPLEFLASELAVRSTLGFPPIGELIVLEVRNAGPQSGSTIDEAVGDDATVYGPATVPRGLRWLIQGARLTPVRMRLRVAVQQLRDAGAAVRVDVDPLDL